MEFFDYPEHKPTIPEGEFVSKDVLSICMDALGVNYEVGEKYYAIDSFCKFNDRTEPCFRSDRFGYGVVIRWAYLPEFEE